MNHRDAVELLRLAVITPGGAWADLGAGTGRFTFALAELLGSDGRVVAVDRDADALAELRATRLQSEWANVRTVDADITKPLQLPGEEPAIFNGLLFANALHFVRNPGAVIARFASWLRPDGRVVVIEYDRRAANPWVPYPIWMDRLPEIAKDAGLTLPRINALAPSAFGGNLYVAVFDRLPPPERASSFSEP